MLPHSRQPLAPPQRPSRRPPDHSPTAVPKLTATATYKSGSIDLFPGLSLGPCRSPPQRLLWLTPSLQPATARSNRRPCPTSCASVADCGAKVACDRRRQNKECVSER